MFARGVDKMRTFGSKKIIIAVIAALFVLLLATAIIGYFLTANKLKNILPGDPIDAITKDEPLKTVDGLTNFLIFCTSYDDPNPKHTGGYLTDSLIILSVNAGAKTAYTISIPRDLWVDYDMSCPSGTSGKINAIYSCALGLYHDDYDKASQILASKIGQITGLNIQYYLEVNYTFIRSLTDALGGIDVDIYSNDSRGIYDPQVGLKLPAGVNHLDGKTALKLARARNSHGGYGLPRSNFDREINQQRIIAAMFKKASHDNLLTRDSGALKLIDALNGQVRTNVRTSKLKSAVSTAKKIDVNKIVSIPLTNHMTTASLRGQSIVQPVAGLSKYLIIQQYIAGEINSGASQ